MRTQKERQDFTSAIVKIQENKKPISNNEIISMRLVQDMQIDNLSFEDMLLAIKTTELRLYRLIELRELDEKFKGND